jgi:ArsR family transcriptional regulator, arsenate/arsenite/antimonite-responsive transcriptional repressor
VLAFAPTVDILAAVAEPLRWRILDLLATEQLCVCHLVEELDAPQPLVSHHLKVLRDAGLVQGERFRYWTYYAIVPGALAHVARTLSDLAAHEPATTRRPCC